MPPYSCLFHFLCNGLAGSGEHTFPSALGGRRRNKKLLCDACQQRFSELDEVLPLQLRLLNTTLGVVGDHSGPIPVMAPMRDEATGRPVLLDDDFNFHSAEPAVEDKGVDAAGRMVRRFSVIGERAQQRMLEKFKRQALRFDILTPPLSTHFLQAAELRNEYGMGGDKAFRAVGRIALNILAAQDAAMARLPGLEAFKRWIFDGTGPDNFCHFANDLSPHLSPPSPFEFKHRITLGVDPQGLVRARVAFFDAFEFALRMGTCAGTAPRIVVVDINPLATRAAPNVDMQTVDLEATAPDVHELGQIFTDQAALAERAEVRGHHVIATGRKRAFLRMLERPVAALNAARGLREPGRTHAFKKALQPLTQVAFNRWLEAISNAADYFDTNNCGPLADAVRAMAQAPHHQIAGARRVVDEIATLLEPVVEARVLRVEDVAAVFEEGLGLSVAVKVVLAQLDQPVSEDAE